MKREEIQTVTAALLAGTAITWGMVVGFAQTAHSATGDVSTWVGGPPPAAPGFADGTGSAARFNHPTGLARDTAGNVFVADRDNNRIRMVTPAGVVSTLAGTGAVGTSNGSAGFATFDHPLDVASDGTSVFVIERGSNRVRMVSGGQVTDFAGGLAGRADGPAATARFNQPHALAWDSGALYVADWNPSDRDAH